jgi:hypothetical protein
MRATFHSHLIVLVAKTNNCDDDRIKKIFQFHVESLCISVSGFRRILYIPVVELSDEKWQNGGTVQSYQCP